MWKFMTLVVKSLHVDYNPKKHRDGWHVSVLFISLTQVQILKLKRFSEMFVVEIF